MGFFLLNSVFIVVSRYTLAGGQYRSAFPSTSVHLRLVQKPQIAYYVLRKRFHSPLIRPGGINRRAIRIIV